MTDITQYSVLRRYQHQFCFILGYLNYALSYSHVMYYYVWFTVVMIIMWISTACKYCRYNHVRRFNSCHEIMMSVAATVQSNIRGETSTYCWFHFGYLGEALHLIMLFIIMQMYLLMVFVLQYLMFVEINYNNDMTITCRDIGLDLSKTLPV